MRFISNVMLLPQTKVKDFLKQAALDIISIPNKPPSTTYPKLADEDPVRNAFHELVTQIERVSSIDTFNSQTVTPIKSSNSANKNTILPRVQRK